MQSLDINIEIIESQIENNLLGIPENGIPENALMTFLTHYPNMSEECIYTEGFNFIIWIDAWAVNPDTKEQEFIAYYEFKVTPRRG